MTARPARFTSEYAPLVNVCRKPGEWQAYDIIYHAPRFDDAGKLLKPGRVTVLQNGVLIQDNVEIKGPTGAAGEPKYTAHPLKQPLTLQDHHNPVRFRNIWIRGVVRRHPAAAPRPGIRWQFRAAESRPKAASCRSRSAPSP